VEPRLSFVTLGVADITRARAFYEKLGFKPSLASTDDVAFYDAGGVVLALWGRADLAKDAGISSEGAGFRGIAMAHNVPTIEEVARVLAEAEAAGGRIVRTSEPSGAGRRVTSQTPTATCGRSPATRSCRSTLRAG